MEYIKNNITEKSLEILEKALNTVYKQYLGRPINNQMLSDLELSVNNCFKYTVLEHADWDKVSFRIKIFEDNIEASIEPANDFTKNLVQKIQEKVLELLTLEEIKPERKDCPTLFNNKE